jgi:hypothetical protein
MENQPSLPEDGQPPLCQTCLDLDYHRFKELEIEDEGDRDEYPSLRYHFLGCQSLKKSADDGCELCSTLYRGITYFWDENEMAACWWAKAGTEDEDHMTPVFLITIQPGRPLQVCRAGPGPDNVSDYSARSVLLGNRLIPGLEFYTDIGMLRYGTLYG